MSDVNPDFAIIACTILAMWTAIAVSRALTARIRGAGR